MFESFKLIYVNEEEVECEKKLTSFSINVPGTNYKISTLKLKYKQKNEMTVREVDRDPQVY